MIIFFAGQVTVTEPETKIKKYIKNIIQPWMSRHTDAHRKDGTHKLSIVMSCGIFASSSSSDSIPARVGVLLGAGVCAGLRRESTKYRGQHENKFLVQLENCSQKDLTDGASVGSGSFLAGGGWFGDSTSF